MLENQIFKEFWTIRDAESESEKSSRHIDSSARHDGRELEIAVS
jgi:hypothetical protein